MAGRIDLMAQKALETAQGDRLLAQRELIKVVLGNDELLRELVAPFLKAITAQVIERVSRGDEAAPPPKPATGSRGDKPALAPLMAKYNPMRAAATAEVAPQPLKASARHVSTLKLLAAAYQAKRGEKV